MMLRVFLIITFIVVGPFQGVSLGKVVIDISDQQIEEMMKLSIGDKSESECCKFVGFIDNLPTFCKLDCKAMVSLAAVTFGQNLEEFELALHEHVNSVDQTVDLRPPIC